MRLLPAFLTIHFPMTTHITQLQPTTQLLYQHEPSIYTSECSTKSLQQLSLWNASQNAHDTHTTTKEIDPTWARAEKLLNQTGEFRLHLDILRQGERIDSWKRTIEMARCTETSTEVPGENHVPRKASYVGSGRERKLKR